MRTSGGLPRLSGRDLVTVTRGKHRPLGEDAAGHVSLSSQPRMPASAKREARVVTGKVGGHTLTRAAAVFEHEGLLSVCAQLQAAWRGWLTGVDSMMHGGTLYIQKLTNPSSRT